MPISLTPAVQGMMLRLRHVGGARLLFISPSIVRIVKPDNWTFNAVNVTFYEVETPANTYGPIAINLSNGDVNTTTLPVGIPVAVLGTPVDDENSVARGVSGTYTRPGGLFNEKFSFLFN